MARYAYPIWNNEQDKMVAIATSAKKCAELIHGYAELQTNGLGDEEYLVARTEGELEEALSENEKIRALLGAYVRDKRQQAEDMTLIAERMVVNSLEDAD